MKRWIHAAAKPTHTYWLEGHILYTDDNGKTQEIKLKDNSIVAKSERDARSKLKYKAAREHCGNSASMDQVRIVMAHIGIEGRIYNLDPILNNMPTQAHYDELREQDKQLEEWRKHQEASDFEIPDDVVDD